MPPGRARTPIAACVAAVAIAAFVAPPGAAAAKRADLAVTSVTGAPASALSGKALPLTVKVRNAGRRKSKAGLVTVRLFDAEAPLLEDPIGTKQVKALRPKKSATVRVDARIPAAGAWKLMTCAPPGTQANDCRASGPVTVTDGSTGGLIDAAFEAGDITRFEALLYRLYAATGDERLPSDLRGSGDPPETDAFAAVAAAWSGLTDAQRAQLLPFSLQPRYAESAWAPSAGPPMTAKRADGEEEDACEALDELDGAWTGIETTHAHFWYAPGNSSAQARAQTLSQEFESKIWPTLTSAFKTVDDAAGAPCDPAGDAKIDIYLTTKDRAGILGTARGAAPALFLPDGGVCGPRPSFIVLRENATRWTLAHEMMHVIQWSYLHCNFESAWIEGTASWAGQHVYPSDQQEHERSFGVGVPFFSMVGFGDWAGDYGYHAWTFWYSLEKKDGVAAIKRLMEAFANNQALSFEQAVDTAASDGLREAWKRYVVERYNQPPVGATGSPVQQAFKQWDNLKATPGAVPVDKVELLAGQTQAITTAPTRLREPMTTWYHRLTFPDSKVRAVKISPGGVGEQGMLLQGFLKLADGSWKVEDWSNQQNINLCRDEDEEDVTEVVLATSNVKGSGLPLGVANHVITARDHCEPPGYTGTYSGVSRIQDAASNLDRTTRFHGTLELDPATGPGVPDGVWTVTDGTLQIESIQGTHGQCTVSSESKTFNLPLPGDTGGYELARYPGPTFFVSAPWVIGNPPAKIGVTYSGGSQCAGTVQQDLYAFGQWKAYSPAPITPKPDGEIAATAVQVSQPPWTSTFTFSLKPE